MNMRLCVAVLFTLGAGVGVTTLGCGGSKSGSGGSTGTTTATTTTKAATGTTTASVSGSTGSASSCDDMCRAQHPAGFMVLNEQVVQSCGCTAGAACATQCMSETACTTKMGLPPSGDPCDMCIQAEGAKGVQSSCAASAALGMTCKNNTDCNALIMCETACFG
jgi:hypothetical protein